MVYIYTYSYMYIDISNMLQRLHRISGIIKPLFHQPSAKISTIVLGYLLVSQQEKGGRERGEGEMEGRRMEGWRNE